MRKILIILTLGAVLVAVSYYKTMLQETKETAAYESGRQQASQDLDLVQSRADSLDQALVATHAELGQAKTALDTVRLAQTDSLQGLVADQQEKIKKLSQKKPTEKSSNTTVARKKTSSKEARNRKILAHYKKLHSNLPGDLSAYEKRVAIAEIREESANKFAITIGELNRIRKAANLKY